MSIWNFLLLAIGAYITSQSLYRRRGRLNQWHQQASAESPEEQQNRNKNNNTNTRPPPVTHTSLMHSPQSKDTSFIINPLVFLPNQQQQQQQQSNNNNDTVYHKNRGYRNGVYGGDGAEGNFFSGAVCLLSIFPTFLLFSTAAMWMCYAATSTPTFLFGDTSLSNTNQAGSNNGLPPNGGGPTPPIITFTNRPGGGITNLREMTELEARGKVLSNTSLDIGHDVATGFGYVFGVLPTLIVIILTLIYCSRL